MTSALEGEDCMPEVKIDFNCNSNIAAINFVLKVLPNML